MFQNIEIVLLLKKEKKMILFPSIIFFRRLYTIFKLEFQIKGKFLTECNKF